MESNILNIQNDCIKIELDNEQLIKSNDNLLNQIDKSFTDEQNELSKIDQITNRERIEQL